MVIVYVVMTVWGLASFKMLQTHIKKKSKNLERTILPLSAHTASITNVANVINLCTTHKMQSNVTLKHVKLGFIWNALISLSENMLTKSLDSILKTGIVHIAHASPTMNSPTRNSSNSTMTVRDLKTTLTMSPVIPISHLIARSVTKISRVNI